MCRHCTMSEAVQRQIEDWADRGCPYTKMQILRRPSAETCPNTFVAFFEDAITVNGRPCTIKLDLHYEGDRIEPGKPMQVLGGLWITGINGAMKPEQHGGRLKRALLAYAPGNAPKLTDGTYGKP